jgi:hypothetical protein
MVLHHDSTTVRPQSIAMCTDIFPHGTVITIKYSANEHIDYCDHAQLPCYADVTWTYKGEWE